MYNKLKQTVAIDYDDTYTINPEMWNWIIGVFTLNKFDVVIVTYRESTQHEDMELQIPNVKDYVFTGGKAKKKYCEDCGITVDIWIDDYPEAICYDYKNLPMQ